MKITHGPQKDWSCRLASTLHELLTREVNLQKEYDHIRFYYRDLIRICESLDIYYVVNSDVDDCMELANRLYACYYSLKSAIERSLLKINIPIINVNKPGFALYPYLIGLLSTTVRGKRPLGMWNMVVPPNTDSFLNAFNTFLDSQSTLLSFMNTSLTNVLDLINLLSPNVRYILPGELVGTVSATAFTNIIVECLPIIAAIGYLLSEMDSVTLIGYVVLSELNHER